MSLVVEVCLNWDGFDAEFFIVALAGFVKIGDIVSDILFTKDLADFNDVFDDLDLEEIKYKPPISELIALSITFTIIGIIFDLYKAFYAIKERRNRKANGTAEDGKRRKYSFVVKYIEESFPSWLLQRIGFIRQIIPQEESKLKNGENDKTSIDEAVTVVDCTAEDATTDKTNDGIKGGEKNVNGDTQDADSDTSKTECECDQEESDDDIEEKYDEWKWWKRLNLIFEEIPQLMILIFFYQKVILVRDCDSVKEKIELCDQNFTEARMLQSTICGDIIGDDTRPSEMIRAKSIPKIIIQTTPNDQSLFDPQWPVFQKTIHDINPDFEFHVFNDYEALRFIDDHFEDSVLPDIYRGVPRSVMRADLFRLASVSVFGGFYMDMDMLAKQSFEPLLDAGFGAIFPREWKKDNSLFVSIHSQQPTDEEEHWQVGNYAFAAIPNHAFVIDALEEAMRRCQKITVSKGASDVTDFDVLHTTGPYMLSEVYHRGRKDGKYGDVYHIFGDDDLPLNRLPHEENNWHKFGPYAEHMLSHTWVTSQRNLEYGNIFSSAGDPLFAENYNTTFTEQDSFVRPITVAIQLFACPQYGSWSIRYNLNPDGGILAQYDYFISHNEAQIDVTKVAYVNEDTPLAFTMENYMSRNESCGVISYAIFEGANVTNATALILQGNPNFQSGWNDPIWEYFTLPKITSEPSAQPSSLPSSSFQPTPGSPSPTAHPSTTSVLDTDTVSPTARFDHNIVKSPSVQPTPGYPSPTSHPSTVPPTARFDPDISKSPSVQATPGYPSPTVHPSTIPVLNTELNTDTTPLQHTTRPPTPAPLTLEQQQICENKKYYVAACGEEQQKYTHDLFISSITSIVFTSLNTLGIFIGWFRSWRRKRRILAKRRRNNANNNMVIDDYNLSYQNIQHWENVALYFQYEKIKQDELAESLPEGAEKDEAKRCASLAENNSLYYMQISSELYQQAQDEEFMEFW